MPEKQKRYYDDDIAREHLELVDAAREATHQYAADTIHENTLKESQRARKIGLGVLRLYANKIDQLVPDRGFMLPSKYQVEQAEDTVKQHLDANFDQIYDNAVIEANIDLTNRRTGQQIRTPDVVVAQAADSEQHLNVNLRK